MLQVSTLIRQPRFLFWLGIVTVYAGLVIWLDFLQGPIWHDEGSFWGTSLQFSDRLIPTLEDISDYREFNTPLPFIIFGALEYLFNGGIFVGRLLNLSLSIAMACLIGWPRQGQKWLHILSLAGLFLCPYYLWLSGRLYTEMLACSLVLLGFICYRSDRLVLSGIAFVLGISARQYMLAFPVGIAAFEIFTALKNRTRPSPKLLIPVLASLSILGWFALFGGLAPASSYAIRQAPNVQKTLLALDLKGGIYFLSIVGLHFVIPELIVFWRGFSLRTLLGARKQYRVQITVAGVCLLLFCLFPPLVAPVGILGKITGSIPIRFWRLVFLYGLALLTCLRFAHLRLETWLLIFNALIMMKAFPWDRYVLPLVVILWYLKSVGALDFEPNGKPTLVEKG